jgi:8-oxo-dGTP diphosphatase
MHKPRDARAARRDDSASEATPYAEPVKWSVRVRRFGYRVAHRLLRVYWFISRPENDGVKCVISDGDLVLLVRHSYGRREWDLPGGGIKRGEAAASAARREMQEELGIEAGEWRSLGSIKVNPYHSRDTVQCFQVELDKPALKVDPVELDAAQWFRRSALPPGIGRFVREILALTG